MDIHQGIQGAALIPLAVLFNIVVNPASAVEFEPPTPVYSEATHDGVYEFRNIHHDGKPVYIQISAAIPTEEARAAIEEYMLPGEFSPAIVQLVIKADLASQGRLLWRTNRKDDYNSEAFVSFNGEIGFMKRGRTSWVPQSAEPGVLKRMGEVHVTNLREEFEQARLIKGETTAEEMKAKFGRVYGSTVFKHADHKRFMRSI